MTGTYSGSSKGLPSDLRLHEKGVSFSKRHPVIPQLNIAALLEFACRKYSRETAIECCGTELSFCELFSMADRVADHLHALGLRKGQIVVLKIPNYWQGIVLFLAMNKLGCVVTFLNSHTPVEETIAYLKRYHSPLFVCCDLSDEECTSLFRLTYLKKIIRIGGDNAPLQDVLNFDCLLDSNTARCRKYKFNFSDDAIILYTSGTTGKPKSVVLTNQNVIATAIYLRNSSGVTGRKNEKSLVCVPFCYPYGFVTSVLMSLLCGRSAILGPDLSKDNIAYYYSLKPNIIFGSPAMMELTMKNIPEDMDLSSVTSFISGGDFLSSGLALSAKEFFRKHGADNVEIINGSGNAETCGGNTNSYGQDVPFLSVGKPYYGVNAITIDEDGRELPYGQTGMLCISGKNVFREYYNEPELTELAKFKYKGRTYFKTGTHGRLLEDGTFELTGRSSRFYIISTLNKVYCDHVQQVLDSIPGIRASAVVRHPDPEKLYVGHAFLIASKDAGAGEITIDSIKNSCQKEHLCINNEKVLLKDYEIPALFTFVEEFPRTEAGKIDYSKLEELSLSES